MSDVYQGSQDQGSTASDQNAIDFIIDQKLARISTSTPVKIVKPPYDKQGNPITPGAAVAIGYVDVLPMVNQLDGLGKAMPHQTVFHLSYFRYQGGNGAFITDPAVGDIGHMIVNDRDTSSVRATDAVANPGSRRKFDKADGIFYGQPQAGAPKQWLAFLTKGFNLTDLYGNTIVGTKNGVLINGCLINQSGDVITKKGVDLDNHVHSGVTAGSDDTGKPAV